MSEYKTYINRINAEIDAINSLRRSNPRRLVIIILIVILILGGYGLWFYIQFWVIPKLEKENTALQSENSELKRDKSQLESENKSLRETVAPLIAQAAREFPGEEINTSLKKIVDRMESLDPLRQPIASATTTVFLTIKSDADVHSHSTKNLAWRACLANGSTVLLGTSANEWEEDQIGNGVVRYKVNLSMSADDSAVGKPIEFLSQAQYIQVDFILMPESSYVTGGKAIFVINNSIRLEFNIPPQQVDNGRIFVRDLSDGLKSLPSRP